MSRPIKPEPNVRRTRIKRRVPRNRRRPNYLLLFSLFLIASATFGSATWLLTSPRMNVTSVEIKGLELTNPGVAEKLASKAVGRNIILLRKKTILSRFAQISEVKTVKMGRKYPNKLWLHITERQPCAVIASGGCCYLIQRDGFVFHKTGVAPNDIVLIKIANAVQPAPGKCAESPTIKTALHIVALARKYDTELHKITIDRTGDICLNMSSDFCVKLGQPDDIALKMSLLRHALLERPSIVREGAYIDLSCPSAPVWKPKAA